MIDESYPGFVECGMVDVHGREWRFIEKVPVVSTEDINRFSTFPRQGVIACEVIARHGDVVRVDFTRPWGIESVEGESQFDIRAEMLIES